MKACLQPEFCFREKLLIYFLILFLEPQMRVWLSIKLLSGISYFNFGIPDEPSCYVRQCQFICALLLELSRGLASCILLFIVYTAMHNCSSSGSLVFATLMLYNILKVRMQYSGKTKIKRIHNVET